ncbi:MAG: hypothetical protein PWQ55_141 [Chloroflexota bacterium]|nr:hypothetical protein [Chloroflexota bacterium]
MAENPLAYLPASQGFYDPPLGLFLPALPRGVIDAWTTENTRPGSLMLDPLGSHPLLAVEAAMSGRRVLMARNNPVLWLLLESICRAPGSEALWKVLSPILISRRGGESMEEHLRGLYATPCAGCGQMIQPQGFVWERGAAQPLARVYTCPHCGDEGEREISPFDLENLERLGSLRLHRARAFQRVLQGGEYEQASIEAALDCYLPRALYVCMTLANRVEQLEWQKEDKLLLQAMLLLVFDEATSLWHWPARNQYHFQLSVPGKFLEKNLWLALESAPERWGRYTSPVQITYWPKLPDEGGGICLYNRRKPDKQDLFQQENPAAVICIFPRPNQAFWTLSAMWSGWLWGRKAVLPMRSALARRRYDWRWFALALEAALGDLCDAIPDGTPLFGLLPQAAPNHLLGLLAGAHASGFELEGFAADLSEELYQCLWCSGEPVKNPIGPLVQSNLRAYLQARGEPARMPAILSDYLARLAMQNSLPVDIQNMEETYFSQLQQNVRDSLERGRFAQEFSTPAGGSKWSLLDPASGQPPVSERLETAVRDKFWEQPHILLQELELHVFRGLPGRLTPETDDLRLCLQSYAEEDEDTPGLYHLRANEDRAVRQADRSEMASLLEKRARSLGLDFNLEDDWKVVWLDEQGKVLHRYYLLNSAIFSALVLNNETKGAGQNVLVFPGSRSRWLQHRLQEDPRLKAALEEKGWHLMKYRYLRWLAAQEENDLARWEGLLDGDPPLEEPSDQFQLF